MFPKLQRRVLAATWLFCFCLVALFAGGSAWSQVVETRTDLLSTRIDAPKAPGGWTRQSLQVPTLLAGEAPPTIDGKLDDPCWRHAVHVAGFFRQNGASPVVEQTEAWLLCDSKTLYVAFHCLDSQPQLIRALQTQRNGSMDNDDFVGLDIDSQNTRRGVSTFQVSARGTQLEQIEGGTADNITWIGDWKAASQTTKEGWNSEMGIPFRLLRYRKGATTFGLLLFRHVSRETTSREAWPYLPPDGDSHESQYLSEMTGITPPFVAPRPVFLPYALATASTSRNNGATALREGLDVKYPITTTLTGLATLYPDFQTVEQAVTDISFSYTEKYLPDHRPFFAEGSDYLPYSDIFYSRRIGQIDGGLKVVGKQNDYTLGLIGLTAGGDAHDPTQRQQAYVGNIVRAFGAYNSLHAEFAENRQGGAVADNEVAKFEYDGGFLGPLGYHPNATVAYLPSWQGSHEAGSKEFFHVGTGAPKGRPNAGINYEVIPDNFVSDLGYIPESNHRGYDAWVEQYNDFDRGKVESYYASLYVGHYRYVRPDAFFNDHYAPELFLAFRAGYAVDLSYNQGQRNDFHDHTTDTDFSWNRHSLFQRGGIHLTTGQVADQPYRYESINQSVLIMHPFSLQVQQNWLSQGPTYQTQTIATATYRLSDTRSLGSRLVRQTGPSDPNSANFVPVGTNLYFSYGQHVRKGYDLFVLVGDPNSPATRGLLTVKVIQPF